MSVKEDDHVTSVPAQIVSNQSVGEETADERAVKRGRQSVRAEHVPWSTVGALVGAGDGNGDGGTLVGAGMGALVGPGTGTLVGIGVGALVGAGTGTDVGADTSQSAASSCRLESVPSSEMTLPLAHASHAVLSL